MGLRHSGFTMIELVTVMVLVGILAVVAIPKLDGSAFVKRGFHDSVVATLNHAREAAVASRRFVCVSLVNGTGSAATVTVTRDLRDPDASSAVAVSCTAAVPLPGVGGCGASNVVCAPGNVSLGGATTVIFDPLGRSVVGATKLVAAVATMTTSEQADITVQPETGYVE